MRTLVIMSLTILNSWAFAADFYVIDSTHKSQIEAQKRAAENGGWVLISNFYKKLTPNTFAVVRGPYKTQKAADKELKSLKEIKKYKQSYVKDAGEIDLNGIRQIKGLSPQVIAAILGEIEITSKEVSGGGNPCVSDEQHNDYSLRYHTLERKMGESGEIEFKAEPVALDIGSLVQIKSTGVIERMRVCAE